MCARISSGRIWPRAVSTAGSLDVHGRPPAWALMAAMVVIPSRETLNAVPDGVPGFGINPPGRASSASSPCSTAPSYSRRFQANRKTRCLPWNSVGGVLRVSRSPSSKTSRCCSLPTQFGNMLAAMWWVTTPARSSTE